MKKVVVMSLGGSLIIPKEINYQFLNKFKKILEKHYRTYRFIVVCGGGNLAREYIKALKQQGKSKKQLSLAGIRATRQNARFMMQFFGKRANDTLPLNMKKVESNLRKNNVVFCGALRYAENSTSDETSAKLARYLKRDLINITNVKGLYSADPRKNRKAKFIPKISWKEFEKKTLKIKYEAGQHFILDQKSSTLIRKSKTTTYIIGPNPKNLSKLLNNKPFTGTTISN